MGLGTGTGCRVAPHWSARGARPICRNVKVECYGSTRPRDGSTSNEDAFWIWRPSSTVAALCDGAGNAQLCASQVLRMFTQQIEGGMLQVDRFPAWSRWLRSTDSAMAGGAQSTFVGLAVTEGRLLGAYAGDSRAYLVNEHGCRLLTEAPCKRLGSGDAEPHPIHEPLAAQDTVLLMSDGAWTPLAPIIIHRAVMAARMREFVDLPVTLIDLAGKHGRADDMTVVALRVR
jgi:serine/threonine protein phosphatase PrpC